ncbi:MAG: Lipopolysaccharide core heptosyltransferase RfaQ [Candidatus Anoxychlamydiales bacterium]|nr:Lipopolysaccharide core heptosyltransferase RfaQ [Candidatus Anoxychlamydiales bacterium]
MPLIENKKHKNSFNNQPLRGKYLVKNFWLYCFLKVVDLFSFIYFSFLKFLTPRSMRERKLKKNENLLKRPKKILLSNIAHLGDTIIATWILPILKQIFPNASIGFICSSSSKEILENNSYIDKIYFVDHWKLNRSKKHLFQKFLKYFRSRKQAIKDIKKEKFDIAIDLYYSFPNSIHFFYKSKIPVRIGYSSAGFENFLTCKNIWANKNQHVISYHLDLLKFLKIDPKVFQNASITPYIYLPSSAKKITINNSKTENFDLNEGYIVCHIGAGSRKKMWNLSKWKDLTAKLLNDDHKIVFTGKGDFENTFINEVIETQDSLKKANCINLCDKINYLKILKILKNARVVICVDSFILHLATALDVLTIVIYCGINNFHHWVFKKSNVIPIVKKLCCSPCYMKNGCETMACLNNIEIDEVLKKMEMFSWKSLNKI